MIPKALNEIEWSDIEALKDSGREEDDTIEFKGSFSGGPDFLGFNDKQQAAAVDGIAKEAIAFLNGRGGDIVIGAKEFKNEHPKIEALTPLSNVVQTVDRLAQALAAIIEPSQSNLAVRAIASPVGEGTGVIVVRVRSSLRAPHRSRRMRECYVRRGRESVPMPMDEIQDLSIRRSDLRTERRGLLDRAIGTIDASPNGRTHIPDYRFHVRAAFVPYQVQQIEIDEVVCSALRGSDPFLILGSTQQRITVPFSRFDHSFLPMLRGKRSENIVRNYRAEGDFQFCAKDIREIGTLTADFACWRSLEGTSDVRFGLYHAWISGFFANALTSFHNVLRERPELHEGYLGVGFFARGQVNCRVADGSFHNDYHWPQGITVLPSFEISSPDDLIGAFDQIQTDASSISGIGTGSNWAFDE